MKMLFKNVLAITLCALPLWINAQTIQVLDNVIISRDGNLGAKFEYQYDEKGIAISETYYFWNSSTNMWIKNSRIEYQYDSNNNQTWTTFFWNSSTDMWVENRKYEFLYTDNRNQTWITSYWDSSINGWMQSKKFEYQYDDNQTLKTRYFWDNSTNIWIKISSTQYNFHYSSLTLNNIPQVNKRQSAVVFPNPATSYITVKGEMESIITVSNLSGGIIYQQVMAGESKTIDVSSWASGVYVISVEKGNNRTVSKIIKQ